MPTGLIIAAHGSITEPDVNAQIRHLTMKITRLRLFDEAVCAFHQGEPSFTDAVDTMSADTIVVVPLMTSQGYYGDTVLPEALAAAGRFSHVRIHQTSVVGHHPRIAECVGRRFHDLVERFGLSLPETALVVVGHGTRKHPESRASTLGCVKALKSSGVVADVLPAFLDDEPSVESVAQAAARRDCVVIPFLISRGAHASVDIAQRFGTCASVLTVPPVLQIVGGRRIVLDLPIGCYTEIIDVVMDLACETLGPLRKAHA